MLASVIGGVGGPQGARIRGDSSIALHDDPTQPRFTAGAFVCALHLYLKHNWVLYLKMLEEFMPR